MPQVCCDGGAVHIDQRFSNNHEVCLIAGDLPKGCASPCVGNDFMTLFSQMQRQSIAYVMRALDQYNFHVNFPQAMRRTFLCGRFYPTRMLVRR